MATHNTDSIHSTYWTLRHAGKSDKGTCDRLIRVVDRHEANRMLLLHGHAPAVAFLLEMGANMATLSTVNLRFMLPAARLRSK